MLVKSVNTSADCRSVRKRMRTCLEPGSCEEGLTEPLTRETTQLMRQLYTRCTWELYIRCTLQCKVYMATLHEMRFTLDLYTGCTLDVMHITQENPHNVHNITLGTA